MVLSFFARLWKRRRAAASRRDFERRPVTAAVVLLVGGERHTCQMADVSAGGAFLSPDPGIPVGGEAILELPNLSIRTPIRVIRRSPAGVGVTFSNQTVGPVIAGWTRGAGANA